MPPASRSFHIVDILELNEQTKAAHHDGTPIPGQTGEPLTYFWSFYVILSILRHLSIYSNYFQSVQYSCLAEAVLKSSQSLGCYNSNVAALTLVTCFNYALSVCSDTYIVCLYRKWDGESPVAWYQSQPPVQPPGHPPRSTSPPMEQLHYRAEGWVLTYK